MTGMNPTELAVELRRNKAIFETMLRGVPEQARTWKPKADEWSLLEVLCHLLDEEREDFRMRTRLVLEDPSVPLPPIDPTAWVRLRRYQEQAYDQVLDEFLQERDISIAWLEARADAAWGNIHCHPRLGPISAAQFLSAWLAHDYLHLRQLTRLRYGFLAAHHPDGYLSYAGVW